MGMEDRAANQNVPRIALAVVTKLDEPIRRRVIHWGKTKDKIQISESND
jgi:hypothetical protein